MSSKKGTKQASVVEVNVLEPFLLFAEFFGDFVCKYTSIPQAQGLLSHSLYPPLHYSSSFSSFFVVQLLALIHIRQVTGV
jgi:hypothetical protein